MVLADLWLNDDGEIVAGFLYVSAAFCAMYVVVCAGLATGGWRKLHACFPCQATPQERTKWCATHVGSSFYQVVRVTVTHDALTMRLCPFTLFHGCIAIPWTFITRVSSATSRPITSGPISISVCTPKGAVPLSFYTDRVAQTIDAILRDRDIRLKNQSDKLQGEV